MAFTVDQQEVIDARNCNILVSAAAGSGKTTVLVERIVQLITDKDNPVDVDRIIVVTFTEKAAAEMKRRIGDALNKKVTENPQDERLARQAVLSQRAFFMTIDAFCKYVISNHYQEIDLDPSYRVIDQNEGEVISRRIVEDVFEEFYSFRDTDEKEYQLFTDTIESFSDSGDDSTLADVVLRMSQNADSFAYPEKWLSNALDQYRIAGKGAGHDTAWMEYLLTDIERLIEDACTEAETCIEILYGESFVKTRATLQSDLDMLNDLLFGLRSVSSDDYIGKLRFLDDNLPNAKSFATFSSPRVQGSDKEDLTFVKGVRDSYKKRIVKIRDDFFARKLDAQLSDVSDMEPVAGEVIRLIIRFREAYAEYKKKHGLIDFSDMEHFALRILLGDDADHPAPTDTALLLRRYFEYVMVDEYQDSNQVQEDILTTISRQDEGEYNMFMVGDVKQSVYAFRKARPQLIMDKLETYQLKDKTHRRINLKANFRSREQVLEATNAVFERSMRPEVGGVDYDIDARLYYGSTEYDKSLEGLTVQMHFLETRKQGNKSQAEMQAELLAKLVKENIASQKVSSDEKIDGVRTTRPCSYKDIAILFRGLKGITEAVRKVFKEQGIPVHITMDDPFFEKDEVQVLMNALAAVENPLDDVAMFGLLHSLLRFSDADIAKITAAAGAGIHLYERALTYALGQDELAQRLAECLDYLDELRTKAEYMSVSDILIELMDRTDYDYYLLAMPDGENRLANARAFSDKAAEFESRGERGILPFLMYLKRLRELGKDPGGIDTTDENADVVHVMSMHKSKGLEYPICICADLNHEFNRSDSKAEFLIDTELGIAMKYRNVKGRTKRDTFFRKILALKKHIEQVGEEERILYVAMTRAKEKLILVSEMHNNHIKDYTDKSETYVTDTFLESAAGWDRMYSDRLSYSYLRDASCHGDILAPSIIHEPFEIVKHTSDDMLQSRIDEEIEVHSRKQALKEVAAQEYSEERYGQYTEVMNAEYSHPELEGLYTKTSVTEVKKAVYEATLKREAEEAGEEASHELFSAKEKDKYIPSFARKDAPEKLKANERGTAVHRMMELLDFSQADSLTSIQKQIDYAVLTGALAERYGKVCDVKKILAFTSSAVGERISKAYKAGKVWPEQPFFMAESAARLDARFPSDEQVLIQGIIDLCWEEEDGLVILDYKTDRVSNLEELDKRYRTQLLFYRDALEAGTGKKVKELLIYSFALEGCISIAP